MFTELKIRGTALKKNKLPFKVVKPHFIGRILSYLNINYCFTGRALNNIWSFILYLEAGETQLINNVRCTVRDSRIGHKCNEKIVKDQDGGLKVPLLLKLRIFTK